VRDEFFAGGRHRALSPKPGPGARGTPAAAQTGYLAGGVWYNPFMKFKKKYLALGAALVVAVGFGACSSLKSKIILKRVGLISSQTYNYVPGEQFKTVDFAPPPAFDSDAQKADLAVTLDWQKKRTKADCDKAQKTADAYYEFFWGDNPPFKQPLPKPVKKFFERLWLDLDTGVNNMKDRYHRPRPFVAYPDQAKPCIAKSGGYSYPSGHSSYSRAFAEVLADIIPERKAEFLAKADEIAQDRVIGGVHFQTDIAAGKAFGELFHDDLLKSPEYLKDVEKMKTYLAR